jgi:alcohol dehydrogenase (cytochrome c)
MSGRRFAIVGAAVLAVVAPAILAAQSAVSYSPVTEQRLLNPEPHNWLMYRGNYSGWGYSPLDQITPGNVKKLVPVWSYSTGVTEGHQAPPIVNDGVMFITTPQQQVIALRAKTGELMWRYKKELPEDLLQLHPTNRGVALWQDRVYVATVDAHLVALDAKTGAVVWDTTVDVSSASAATSPLSTRAMASRCGRHTRFPVPASRATTPGTATRGRRAASRCG